MENNLVAFIRETSFLDANMDLPGYVFEHGTHNGYVAVPPENRYHGRSWEEFRKRYPVTKDEYCIKEPGYTLGAQTNFETRNCATWCTSEEEAKAFLALMQLRQLRKAWVGDWKQPSSRICIAAIAYDINKTEVVVEVGNYWSNMTLSFPTKEIAEDFLYCFRDLCETAKILL